MIPARSIVNNSAKAQASATPIHQSVCHGGPLFRPASLGWVSDRLAAGWICMGQPHLLQKRSPSDGMASQSGFAQGGSSKRSPQWGQNWASSDTSLPQPLHSSTPVGLFGGLRETVGASRSGGPDGGLCGGGGFLAGFRAKALTPLTIQSMPAPTSPPIRTPTIATPKIGTDPSYSPPNRAQMVQATPMTPPVTAKRVVKNSVSLFNYFNFGLAAGWTEVKVRVQPCSAVSAVHSNKVTRAASGGLQSRHHPLRGGVAD